METEGVNAQVQYVVSRSGRNLATARRIISDGKKRVNVWRRTARMNAANADAASETLQINKKNLGAARKTLEANIVHKHAARKMIRHLSGIYNH